MKQSDAIGLAGVIILLGFVGGCIYYLSGVWRIRSFATEKEAKIAVNNWVKAGDKVKYSGAGSDANNDVVFDGVRSRSKRFCDLNKTSSQFVCGEKVLDTREVVDEQMWERASLSGGLHYFRFNRGQ